VIIGFTGSRYGLTREAQIESAVSLLRRLRDVGFWEFWHGNCVGADTQMAGVAHTLGLKTVAWPGKDTPDLQDMSFVSDETREPQANLRRNKAIAQGCGVLVAAPKQTEEVLRSGTWSAVRYARQVQKTIYIVQPDGRIDKETPERISPERLVSRKVEHGIQLKKERPFA